MRKTYELLMKIAGKVDASYTSAINQTTDSLASVQKKADSLTGGLMKMAGVVGAAIGIKSLATTFDNLASRGDKAAKQARTLGMQVEALQELDYAFGQEGIDNFSGSLETMRKNLIQAAAGQGKALKVLQEYNLDADKLSKMAPEKMIERLSDFMRRLPGDTDRSRLAISLFGEEGQDLARVMSELGSEGIQSLRTQARATGSIIGSELAKQAESYEDAKSKLGATVEGIKVQIFGPLLPKITSIFDKISERIMGSGVDIAALGERIAAKADEIIPKVLEFADQAGAFISKIWEGASAIAEFFGGWENVIKTVGIAIGVFKTFQTVMAIGGFIASLNPATLGIMAIVAAITLVVKNWDKIKEAAGKALDFVKEKVSAVKEWIGEKFEAAKNFVMGIWDGITSFFGTLFDNVREAISIPFKLLSGDFEGAYESVTKIWNNIKEFFGKIWDALPDGLKAAVERVLGFLKPVTDFFGGIADKAKGFVGGAVDKVKGFFGGGSVTNDEVPGYATGGFVKRSQLATIAEKAPEWIIPQDGSQNAFGLWKAAGMQFKNALAGFGLNGDSAMAVPSPMQIGLGRITKSPEGISVSINYSPINNFNGTSKEMQQQVAQQQRRDADDLERRLRDIIAERKRLSYA